MTQQHGSHLADIRRSRLITAEEAPLTATEMEWRHHAHAFVLKNPTAIGSEVGNTVDVQPMVRSRCILGGTTKRTQSWFWPNSRAGDTGIAGNPDGSWRLESENDRFAVAWIGPRALGATSLRRRLLTSFPHHFCPGAIVNNAPQFGWNHLTYGGAIHQPTALTRVKSLPTIRRP